MIRIRPENVFDTLDFLREKWDEIVPDVPFDHNFLDEEIDRQYREEERWFKIAGYATFFAVFIACMGAFGLDVTHRCQADQGNRDPENPWRANNTYRLPAGPGIRGPRRHCRFDRMACHLPRRGALAARLRVSRGSGASGHFCWEALLMLLMVLLAVSLQVTRAARANPVDALRYE